MSSTILVSGTASNVNLPVDTDLRAQLAADAATVDWLQMDASTCTVTSGAVKSCTSIGTQASVYSTTLAGATLADQDSYNGYSAITLTGVGAQMLKGPQQSTLGSEFSVLVFARRPASISASAFWFVQRDSASSHHTSLGYGANGSVQGFHRGTGVTLSAATTTADASPLLSILSFSGSVLRGLITGGALVTAAATGAATTYEALSSIWGQSSAYPSGDGSDVVLLSKDILAAGNEDLLAYWQAYFTEVYS